MKTLFLLRAAIAAALMVVLPCLSASAQTTRGDFDYDGQTGISDVTTLVNFLLYGDWNEQPENVQRDTVHISLCGGYDIVMVHVEGGSYPISEGITATVGDFSIAQTEVTEGLWNAVMSNQATYGNLENCPKAYVSWDECQEFITRLNELTGLTFRLPLSIEWGFAARGGNLSRGFTFAGSNNPLLVAWHSANSPSGPQDVAKLTPNELGLYDMSGNLNEWCQDVGSTSSHRVFRGGSYDEAASQCHVTQTSGGVSYRQLRIVGFRLAM